jgi:hypothetical protein
MSPHVAKTQNNIIITRILSVLYEEIGCTAVTICNRNTNFVLMFYPMLYKTKMLENARNRNWIYNKCQGLYETEQNWQINYHDIHPSAVEDKINEDEMGGACSAHGEMIMRTKFGWGSLKGRDFWEDDLDGRGGRLEVWIEFIWLGIGSDVGLLWTRYWTFGFHKRRGISWPVERLLTFQKRLSTIELISH